MSIFTLAFIRAALERAVKSAAQGAILAFGAGQANVLDLDWAVLGGFAGGAFVLSVLTSVGSDALTKGDGPSLTDAEVLPRDVVEPPALAPQLASLHQAVAALPGKVAQQLGQVKP